MAEEKKTEDNEAKGRAGLPDRKAIAQVRRILQFVKPYRWKFVLGLVFLFVSSVLTLTLPLGFKYLLDAVDTVIRIDWTDLVTEGPEHLYYLARNGPALVRKAIARAINRTRLW